MNEDMLQFLRTVHRLGVLEIGDHEEPNPRQAGLIERALEGGLLRDDGSGFDFSSRLVMTAKGCEAIGVAPEPSLWQSVVSCFVARARRRSYPGS